MTNLDVADRLSSVINCLKKIGPEQSEIVPVRLLQLGIFVELFLTLLEG